MSFPVKGFLIIIPPFIHVRQKIHDALPGIVTEEYQTMIVPYENELALIDIMERLFQFFSALEKQKTLVCLAEDKDLLWHSLATMRTFQSLYTMVNRREVVELLGRKNGLTFAMQPIWSMASRKIHSVECLVRGKGMEGLIPPDILLETAQEINVEISLDRHLRELAIKEGVPFAKQGMKVFINFSPTSIYDLDSCLNRITYIIDMLGVPRSDFVFEIIETDRVDDQEHLKRIVNGFRERGMEIALDDIGSGYSSLLYILELKPNYIKIDKAIVNGCARDISKATFLKAIVELCKQLEIQVVAEGVELEEDLRYCMGLSVDFVQGYLLGRPSLYTEMLERSWSEMEHHMIRR